MGDPAPVGVSGPRTLVRQCPSTRIPLPSPAAAAACLPTSGPPALFGTRRAARCPVSGTTGCSPSRAMRRTTIHPPPRRYPGIARFRALRLSWPSVVPPPSARYRGYGGPCPAMRRPPTLQRCSMALGRHPPAGDAITPGSSVPATSLCGDQVMRGTLAPRHHAGTNFLLTETLAATGLEADFAPRHYRGSPSMPSPLPHTYGL